MSDYYEKLPSLKVTEPIFFLPSGGIGLPDEKVYEKAEWLPSGDFIIIYQESLKTIIPMSKISTIEVLSPTPNKN